MSEENDYDDTEDTDDSGTSILPTQTLTSSTDEQQQDKITKNSQQGKRAISEKMLRSISTDNEPCLNSANNLAKEEKTTLQWLRHDKIRPNFNLLVCGP